MLNDLEMKDIENFIAYLKFEGDRLNNPLMFSNLIGQLNCKLVANKNSLELEKFIGMGI